MMRDAFLSLDTLAPGFTDPVHDAQAVFRVLLDALARPGTTGWIEATPGHGDKLTPARTSTPTSVPILEPTPSSIPASIPAPTPTPVAALAALLTLCDYATPVWLQARDDALASTIRFHTGAPLVDAPARAAFAYVDSPAALPAPESFALGEPESPEHAATVLIRVDAFEGGRPLTLTGPGIETSASIAPLGIPDDFWLARAALAPAFPCGIDCYLVCGRAVLGIPRTTHVELN
jgi:alpha-D-ribose 1-methylphosphonate 5-triphosphate synthase subunit PhnH